MKDLTPSHSGYNSLGQYIQAAFSNGVTTSYQYYPDNNRLNSITTNSPTAGNLLDLIYGYDNVGNIDAITDTVNPSRNRTYLYDHLDRLTDAISDSYGGTLAYTYDDIGNMTYNCRNGSYIYNEQPNQPRPHAVKRIESGGQVMDEYFYDDNGNMTSGAGRTFTYDYDNMPTSIVYGGNAVISVYDASGQRVQKMATVGGMNKTTTYIGDIYECTDGECTKYIFAGSQRIAKIDSADTYYYHSDHLGSSSIMTDSTGSQVQDIYYYPYGEIKTNLGSDVTSYKFTDQEWDAETGLYYYNARYYDPKLARFISADTIVPESFNPQALNRYSYVVNNPVVYIDPSGHCVTVTFTTTGGGGHSTPPSSYSPVGVGSGSSTNTTPTGRGGGSRNGGGGSSPTTVSQPNPTSYDMMNVINSNSMNPMVSNIYFTGQADVGSVVGNGNYGRGATISAVGFMTNDWLHETGSPWLRSTYNKMRTVAKNPRFKAFASLGASKLAEYAAENMEPGQTRGAVYLIAAGLATHSAGEALNVTAASTVILFSPMDAGVSKPAAALGAITFGFMTVYDANLALEYFNNASKDFSR